MSKYNDKYRQRRLGDSRWIDKIAIDDNDFDNDDSQAEQPIVSHDNGDQWSGLQFVSFGSGSSGNCAFLGTENGGVLIDAGIDPQHVCRDLAANGIDIRKVKGILLTHDHADHIRYAYKLVREHRHLRIYCTPRLMGGLLRHHNISRRIKDYQVSIFKEIPFFLAGMKFTAFETSHDAIDNMGFSIEVGDNKFVIATDMGIITERAAHYMSQANFLMIESNYDRKMLDSGRYPEYLKARVRGNLGHLDNSVAAQYVAANYHEGLKWVFLCHLSNDNNTPEKALGEMTAALEARGVSVGDGSNSPDSRCKAIQVYALPRYDTSLWFVL
ncbi:MAG: MBL fold metallo-hydrolase [Muribaculaceae bacterium]|nr:MBL fold metallo-hydrolase [Muribaculaceae bacterium]